MNQMVSNYTDKCGSCDKFIYCVMDGTIRAIGNCYKRGNPEVKSACNPKCKYYVKGKGINTDDREKAL